MLPRGVWHVTRNAVTIAHEGGHGLVALLTGRRLQGIRLHSDTSGLTVSRGKPHGLGMVLTAAAGYTAPPLLGLAGAALLAAGHITALLWGAMVLLLVMLVMIRNAYGVLTVVVAGGAFLLVSWLTKAQVQAAFGYLVVWFLLAGRRPAGRRAPAQARRSGPHGTPTPTSSPGSPTSRPRVARPLLRGRPVLAGRRRPLAAGGAERARWAPPGARRDPGPGVADDGRRLIRVPAGFAAFADLSSPCRATRVAVP